MSNLSTKKLRGCLNPQIPEKSHYHWHIFPDCRRHCHEIHRIFLPHFLSRIFKEEGLGVIGLISPVLILVHSVCASGIQNAITRFVAASKKDKSAEAYGYLYTGVLISLLLSAGMAYLVFHYAAFISRVIIGEPRCTPLLQISALSFPLAALHSCINGFLLWLSKGSSPSLLYDS